MSDHGRRTHGLIAFAVAILVSLAFLRREIHQNTFFGMGWHSWSEALAAPAGLAIGGACAFAVMLGVAFIVKRKR